MCVCVADLFHVFIDVSKWRPCLFCFFSTFHLRNSRLFKLRAHEGRFEGFQMRSFTFYLEGEQKKNKKPF